jgi:hypothetical protein
VREIVNSLLALADTEVLVSAIVMLLGITI